MTEKNIKQCPNCNCKFEFNKQYGFVLEMKGHSGGFWVKHCPMCGHDIFKTYFQTDVQTFDLLGFVNKAISYGDERYLKGVRDTLKTIGLFFWSRDDFPHSFIKKEENDFIDDLREFLDTKEYNKKKW